MYWVLAGTATLGGVAIFFCVPRDRRDSTVDRRVDWVGAATITVSLICFLFALAQGEVAPQGWKTPCKPFEFETHLPRRDLPTLTRHNRASRPLHLWYRWLHPLGVLPRSGNRFPAIDAP